MILKIFTEHSNDMDHIYKNIKEYNPNKKCKILIVFDVIADMFSNKNLNPIVTELFISGRKLIVSFAFIAKYYFAVSKNVRLNFKYYFIMKIPNKQELQQLAFHHSSHIDFRDWMHLYKKCTLKPYPFFVIDATLVSDNPSHFRKNILERLLERI